MHDFLVIGLSAALATVVILYVFRTRELREANEFLADAQAEAMNRAVEAERAQAIAQTEALYLKQTITQILQRPVQTFLSEEQFQVLQNSIASIVQTTIKPTAVN